MEHCETSGDPYGALGKLLANPLVITQIDVPKIPLQESLSKIVQETPPEIEVNVMDNVVEALVQPHISLGPLMQTMEAMVNDTKERKSSYIESLPPPIDDLRVHANRCFFRNILLP